jgi:hypothetical protein
MTKLFRDVDYYIVQASNSTQREFELDFADVIEVYDTNETTITTEDGRTLVITWEDNYYKSYRVIYETPLMESSFKRDVVKEIIKKLQTIDVDGETMQYILEKVGMEDQMLKQLISTADDYQINWYTNLRNIAKNN